MHINDARRPTESRGLLPPAAPDRTRILIVDDSDVIRRLMRRSLEPEFEIVAEFADPSIAVSQIAEVDPDVVVIDFNMPGMNGEEAIPLMKHQLPDVTIVGFTGEPPTIRDRMVLAGAEAVFHKLDIRALVSFLRFLS